MIATPHMLAGAAAASRVRRPSAALAVGALMHLLLDGVPHRDYRRGALGGVVLAVDLAVGTLAVCGLPGCSPVRLAGAFGGLLPDLLGRAERRLAVRPTGWIHATAHTDSRPGVRASVAIQTLVIAISLLELSMMDHSPSSAAVLRRGRSRSESRSWVTRSRWARRLTPRLAAALLHGTLPLRAQGDRDAHR